MSDVGGTSGSSYHSAVPAKRIALRRRFTPQQSDKSFPRWLTLRFLQLLDLVLFIFFFFIQCMLLNLFSSFSSFHSFRDHHLQIRKAKQFRKTISEWASVIYLFTYFFCYWRSYQAMGFSVYVILRLPFHCCMQDNLNQTH